MGAYDVIDEAIKGLKYGLDSRIEGGGACGEADGIEFGEPVFGYIGEPVKVYNFHNDVGKIVFDADIVTSNVVTITVNGTAAADVTYATSHDNTMDLLVAAVSALTGVECELDADDTDNRTLLIRTLGTDATVAEAITGGASQATGTITYGSSQVYLGIAMLTQNSETLYEQYDAVNVMAEGFIWVETVENCEANDVAYVYATAGDDFGKISSSGNTIAARFRSNGTAGNLALVFTEGQTKMTYADIF